MGKPSSRPLPMSKIDKRASLSSLGGRKRKHRRHKLKLARQETLNKVVNKIRHESLLAFNDSDNELTPNISLSDQSTSYITFTLDETHNSTNKTGTKINNKHDVKRVQQIPTHTNILRNKSLTGFKETEITPYYVPLSNLTTNNVNDDFNKPESNENMQCKDQSVPRTQDNKTKGVAVEIQDDSLLEHALNIDNDSDTSNISLNDTILPLNTDLPANNIEGLKKNQHKSNTIKVPDDSILAPNKANTSEISISEISSTNFTSTSNFTVIEINDSISKPPANNNNNQEATKVASLDYIPLNMGLNKSNAENYIYEVPDSNLREAGDKDTVDGFEQNHSVIVVDNSYSRNNTVSDLIVIDDGPSHGRRRTKKLRKPFSSTPKRNTQQNETKRARFDDMSDVSALTIDLTEEGRFGPRAEVINLEENEADDCTFVSADSRSMSGDSEVTVVNMWQKKNTRGIQKKKLRKFAKGITDLNNSQKQELLQMITNTLFKECNVTQNFRQANMNQATTNEDRFINQLLAPSNPRNSVGSNIYNPERARRKGLRMVVIDGSNVAMQHGNGNNFSVIGLKICIEYFLRRGHVVKAFVPRYRCKFGRSTDPKLLDQLEKIGVVVYTPSREVQGRQICPYDDRFIVQCAVEFDGVIVSQDNYRDLLMENKRWRQVIENNLLQFTWVNNMIMFPRDPLGRGGPTLEQFLRHPE